MGSAPGPAVTTPTARAKPAKRTTPAAAASSASSTVNAEAAEPDILTFLGSQSGKSLLYVGLILLLLASLRDPTCMFTLPSFTEQFLFLRHFPLDKARVVQGSIRSLPTHGKAPPPSLSAERVGWRGSLVRYMRDGNERKDRNCARAVCSS